MHWQAESPSRLESQGAPSTSAASSLQSPPSSTARPLSPPSRSPPPSAVSPRSLPSPSVSDLQSLPAPSSSQQFFFLAFLPYHHGTSSSISSNPSLSSARWSARPCLDCLIRLHQVLFRSVFFRVARYFLVWKKSAIVMQCCVCLWCRI